MASWPQGFARVPADDWVQQPLEDLAKKYDTVEQHGWYDNLDPTLEQLAAQLRGDGVCIDYSGGTGILVDRFFRRQGNTKSRFVIVDASPKFLRLALEKLGADPRVAFRHLRYLKDQKRLQLLDEVIEPALRSAGIDVLVSTNAIHLYYDLDDTLSSWIRSLRGGGVALVQSGNIANPQAPQGSWIIDDTVERVQEHAAALVREQERFAPFRAVLADTARLEAYAALRRKVFVPVRPLAYYTAALERAGFEVTAAETRTFTAKVSEWFEFLSAYDEGVLGWAGGAAKIDGQPAAPPLAALRLELLHDGLGRLFGGAPTFPAVWTYLSCRKRS